ncbi:MAG TPA: hypothetical protein VJQ57_15820, partial [Acidimicrobiia bacterium]|nr:hypothetical protein [Acidimicrobiia bacterium]
LGAICLGGVAAFLILFVQVKVEGCITPTALKGSRALRRVAASALCGGCPEHRPHAGGRL